MKSTIQLLTLDKPPEDGVPYLAVWEWEDNIWVEMWIRYDEQVYHIDGEGMNSVDFEKWPENIKYYRAEAGVIH